MILLRNKSLVHYQYLKCVHLFSAVVMTYSQFDTFLYRVHVYSYQQSPYQGNALQSFTQSLKQGKFKLKKKKTQKSSRHL